MLNYQRVKQKLGCNIPSGSDCYIAIEHVHIGQWEGLSHILLKNKKMFQTTNQSIVNKKFGNSGNS